MQIHVSAALYGSSNVMERLLADVDHFLGPAVTVLHVSKGSSMADVGSLNMSGTLLLNPEQQRVGHYGASIFCVHLKNIALLERHLSDVGEAQKAADDKVVLVAANQLFFRSCRQYILQHDLTFSLGQTTDLRPSQQHPAVRYPSAEWSSLLKRVAASDDRFIQRNAVHQSFVQFMHNSTVYGGSLPSVRGH